jgi:hypothetical protein
VAVDERFGGNRQERARADDETRAILRGGLSDIRVLWS